MSLLRQLVVASNGKTVIPEKSYSAIDAKTQGSLKCDAVWSNQSQLYLDLEATDSASTNGIWPNLTANMIFFAIALAIFILVKRKIFNQGTDAPSNSSAPVTQNTQNTMGNLIYGQMANQQNRESDEDYQRRKWYQWIAALLSESDYLLLTRGGLGALEYVRFQRYVLGMSIMVALISICIVLPVNLGADSLLSDPIGKTSIFNVPPESKRLWFPIWFTLILFPLGLVGMRSFGYKVPLSDRPPEGDTKTLMVSGLPSTRANAEMIRNHFRYSQPSQYSTAYHSEIVPREAYPGYEIVDVCLSYDVSKLNVLEDELRQAEKCLDYIAAQPVGSDDMKVNIGGCCGGFCGKKIDAMKYYALKKSELQQEIDMEGRRWRKINPVFFVTFATDNQAQRVYDEHQSCQRLCNAPSPQTMYSDDLKSDQWRAFYAPAPSSINWQNLNVSGSRWYLRATLVNLVLLGIIAVVATLVIALNYTGLPRLQKLSERMQNPGVTQISPALILLLMQLVIPEVIVKSVKWMGYWTRPKQIIAEMRLIFTNLLLAILILPSLGLIGAVASLFKGDFSPDTQRQCIMLPDSGALYINYLIFVAFTSTACSLFRVNVIVDYLVRRWQSKSEAERVLAGQVNRPFAFGEEYANFLTVFTVTIVFSFISPIVSLFGVIGMMMKYFLDQYMLCNVYKRSSIPNSVHAVAINQLFSGIILQLMIVTLVYILRNGLDGKTTVLILAFITFGSIFIAMTFFGMLQKVSLFELLNNGQGEFPEEPMELSRRRYLPPSLTRLEQRDV